MRLGPGGDWEARITGEGTSQRAGGPPGEGGREPSWPLRRPFRLVVSECPRQDSNLRSRLRSAFLSNAVTWPYIRNQVPLGRAWGAEGVRTWLLASHPGSG